LAADLAILFTVVMHHQAGEVTKLLRLLRAGDRKAESELFELTYAELRRMARAKLNGERIGHTLTPTALVHEAYVRLSERDHTLFDRTHFFAVAATAMRRVLVDHARARQAAKRGSAPDRIGLEDAEISSPEFDEQLLALDEALDSLSQTNPRQSKVVEMRYFAGLSEQEIADILEVTSRTVNRDWQMARAWLHQRLYA
jgi:RNA polymerase sigma factor (TIGR02999 family)